MGKTNMSQERTFDREYYELDVLRLHDKLTSMVKDAEEVSGKNVYSRGIVQWDVSGKQFSPVGSTVRLLPGGWYRFVYNGRFMVPELMDIRNDELIKLPMPEYSAVLEDMKRFWESEPLYRKYKFPYKRGILLYGRPGTGKSGLLRLLGDDLISNKDGVIFNIGTPDDIHAFSSIFSAFREIEPKRKAICVLEDVDNFMRYGGSTQAALLNILDGNMQYDNIVFVATTNFPDMLLESLINRPSRFDRRYEISTPSKEAREVYISSKFVDLPKEDVVKISEATEGFSIDQLKETVLSIYVLGYPFDFVIEEMKRLFVYNGKTGDNADRFKKGGGFDSVKDDNFRTQFDNELTR